MISLDELTQTVIRGDVEACSQVTMKALNAGIPAMEILGKGLLPGINAIGEQFERGQIYFPELLMSANAMKTAQTLLKPELSRQKFSPRGKYVIGTVRGDAHDIGKNIVTMILEQKGWEVMDLGVDVPSERFCEAVDKYDFDVLGMSALLTVTMPMMIETIDALNSAGLRAKVKIMVGGAPITQEWASKIGADGYATNAFAAARVAERLIQIS